MQDVLIIGAGVAGLTLAREIKKAGRDVLFLEKSRGLGGRSATRTVNGNRVDPGAQYFTARDPRFQKQVDEWSHQGYLKIWSHGFHRLTDKGLEVPSQGNPRYVFPQGMNTMGKLLGEGLNIRTQTKVTSVSKKGDIWLVSSETGEVVEARTVVLNMPPEQILALCQVDLGEVKRELERVVMEPCFALMLGYDLTTVPAWQGVLVEIPGPISWIAHDSSKRTNPKETTLVIHSTPAFARDYFDEASDKVKEKLSSAFRDLNLPETRDPKPQTLLWSDLQRWKYALASTHLDLPYVQYDETFYLCGDWCGGARLESAYLSGVSLAEKFS
jgi:renalase